MRRADRREEKAMTAQTCNCSASTAGADRAGQVFAKRAAFTLDGALMEGSMSGQALRLIREWSALHPGELHDNWQLAVQHLPLNRIPPLT